MNLFDLFESNRKDVDEGHYIVPSIDRDRYTDLSHEGLEGPFGLKSGKVVYYDPKEGKYYDRDRDMYMSHDEVDHHNQELDEKLGSNLVNRRQAHAYITKFKKHKFEEEENDFNDEIDDPKYSKKKFGSCESKEIGEGIAGNMTVRSDALTNLKKPEDLTPAGKDPFKGNPNRNALVSAQARNNPVAKFAQSVAKGSGSHKNTNLNVKKGKFRELKHKGSFDFSESRNFLEWAIASGYNVIGNPAIYESAKCEYNMLLAEIKKKS
jgi:hypothetical protein